MSSKIRVRKIALFTFEVRYNQGVMVFPLNDCHSFMVEKGGLNEITLTIFFDKIDKPFRVVQWVQDDGDDFYIEQEILRIHKEFSLVFGIDLNQEDSDGETHQP